MITGAEQWQYVIAAYSAVALVLAALTGWIVFDARRRRAELTDLEARGVRRRSARES